MPWQLIAFAEANPTMVWEWQWIDFHVAVPFAAF